MKKPIVNLKAFRTANQLSQKEIADLLGVSIAFVSAVERGAAKLPEDKIAMLRANDRGWDVSRLDDFVISSGRNNEEEAIHLQHVIKENERLKAEVARLMAEIEFYHKTTDRLLGILEGRCGIKPDEK